MHTRAWKLPEPTGRKAASTTGGLSCRILLPVCAGLSFFGLVPVSQGKQPSRAGLAVCQGQGKVDSTPPPALLHSIVHVGRHLAQWLLP